MPGRVSTIASWFAALGSIEMMVPKTAEVGHHLGARLRAFACSSASASARRLRELQNMKKIRAPPGRRAVMIVNGSNVHEREGTFRCAGARTKSACA